MSEPRNGLTLELSCVVEAPREQVFDLLTQARRAGQVVGTARGSRPPRPRWTCVSAGGYRFTMQPPAGEAFHLSGRFLEIDPPNRLRYTFDWDEPVPRRPGDGRRRCPCAPWLTPRSCPCHRATSRPRNDLRCIETAGRCPSRSRELAMIDDFPSSTSIDPDPGIAGPRVEHAAPVRRLVPGYRQRAIRWPGSWGRSRARASRSSEKSRLNSSAWPVATGSPAIGWCSSSPTSRAGRPASAPGRTPSSRAPGPGLPRARHRHQGTCRRHEPDPEVDPPAFGASAEGRRHTTPVR